MFDPINFSDSSAEFRFDPAATMSLSTLEFSPEPTPPAELQAPAPAEPLPSTDSGSVFDGPPPDSLAEITLPDVGAAAEAAVAASSTEQTRPGVAVPEPPLEPEEFSRSTTTAAEEREASIETPPELPPSRTLAELYEKQGFRDEARRIYERLAEEHPEDESLTRRIAVVRGDSAARPAESDPRARRRLALESWLARVKANAAPGGRP
jgi:hypothetical protein